MVGSGGGWKVLDGGDECGKMRADAVFGSRKCGKLRREKKKF